MQEITSKDIRLVACPHPFSTERLDLTVAYGQTVSEIISRLDKKAYCDYVIQINDQRIAPEDWERVMPRHGDVVIVRGVVHGGGGGGGGKDPLRTIMTIAVVAAAAWAGPALAGYLGTTAFSATGIGSAFLTSGFAGSVLSAGVLAVGTLALNAIAPPSRPDLPSVASNRGIKESPTYSISGVRNRGNQYGPIPVVMGNHRITPPYGALPYTEVVGNDQYLRVIFVLGYGPLDISQMQIGETLLSDFDDIQVEVMDGTTEQESTLFPGDVYEANLSIVLRQVDGWQLRTTQPNVDEIQVDVTFPRGLVKFTDQGERSNLSVQAELQYAVTGTSNWKGLLSGSSFGSRTVSGLRIPYDSCGSVDSGGWCTGYALSWRYYRVVIHKINGGLHLLEGGVYFPAEGRGIINDYPPIPTWAWPICKVGVANSMFLGSHFLIDERPSTTTLTGFAPVSITKVVNPVITIASGTIQTDTLNFTEATNQTIRRTIAFSVDRNQYDVRLRRITGDRTGTQELDDISWTILRSMTNEDPITETGLAKVALRIRATEQLNGTIDTFNCVGRSIIPDYDAETDTWVTRPTNNPASLYRYVLQGIPNKRPLPDSAIDLDKLEEWHVFCADSGFTFNHYMDYRSSVADALSMIAAAGRAARSYVDGKYSVVIDKPQTTPIQHITPRNSWGFSSQKTFTKIPHAFRVIFFNEEKDYREDERIVYDDGYNQSNATEIETLDLAGITNPQAVWKLARYHIATLRLRPEKYTFQMDFEHLVFTRGDLVRLSHDVLLVGLGWGRVKAVQDNGSQYTGVTIDEALYMETGKSYSIRFRLDVSSGGTNTVVTAINNPGSGTYNTVTFTNPIDFANPAPAVGDLAMFGEVGLESAEYIIKSIDPSADMTAKITALDYSPAIYTADSGNIPAFTSNITAPVTADRTFTPVIEEIRSDESALIVTPDGTLLPQALLTVKNTALNTPGLIEFLEVQYRLSGSSVEWTAMRVPGSVTSVSVLAVEQGLTYEFRAAYVINGQANNWSPVITHTIVGESTPPPNIVSIFAETDYIRWEYPNKPIDFLGFVVRYRTGTAISWEDAVPAFEGVITENFIRKDALPSGSRTVLVKAVDRSGNYSDKAAYIITNLGDVIVDNVIITEDYKAASYPGTITNGSVIGSEIKADSQGLLFWNSNTSAAFWGVDNAALFWVDQYEEMTYVVEYVPELDYLPSFMTLTTDITGNPYSIQYFTGGDSAFWEADAVAFWEDDSAVFWNASTEYKVWPGKLETKRQKYTIKITTGEGYIQGVISDFKILMDVPDIEESFNDVIIATGGTRLPLVNSYRDIVNIQLTLQSDGGSAITTEVIDKDETLGPLIKCFDSSHVATSGKVDVALQGY